MRPGGVVGGRVVPPVLTGGSTQPGWAASTSTLWPALSPTQPRLMAYRTIATMQYADVMLPIAPFSETAGTFVNCEGRAQTFHAVVYPRGEARPAWKVLRVLGTLLRLPEFDIDTSEAVRDAVLQKPIEGGLNNATNVAIERPNTTPAPLERVADVPIYFADPLVRRAVSLQLTADARPPTARMHRSLLEKLGLAEGSQVKVKQGRGEAVLAADVDAAVPPGVVRIAAAHASTCGLEGLSGPVTVEKA